MVSDPSDPCCMTPSCPAGITVVPNMGQSISGFAPANGGSGTVPGTMTGGGTPTGTMSTMTGQRSEWILSFFPFQWVFRNSLFSFHMINWCQVLSSQQLS